MQIEYVFAFEVTQTLLTPGKSGSICCLDLAHEGEEGFDPAIRSTACLIVDAICRTSFPVETVDGVRIPLA